MAGTSGAGPYYTSRCSLPSSWETRVTGIRNQHALQYLKVDGTRVRYVGPGTDDAQAATVRSDYPLPADCPLYYFEVTVLDRGREGFIGVGFCTAEVVLCRLPGWDAHSYGYHGDDGHAFSGSGLGRPYGPSYSTGDVVGALYDRSDNSISYFKNGEPLGAAFRDVSESGPLYPCVGLRTRGEEVVANFGVGSSPEPFRTDFQAIRAAYQRRVLDGVRACQLPLLSAAGSPLLPQLMYDYLLHQRYPRTAALLARDLLRAGGGGNGGGAGGGGAGAGLDEAALADIAVRQESYDLVAGGRIDEALALLRGKYPRELLSERPSLDFRLRLQKFVEMVAAANAAAAASAPAPAAVAADAGASRAGVCGSGGDGGGEDGDAVASPSGRKAGQKAAGAADLKEELSGRAETPVALMDTGPGPDSETHGSEGERVAHGSHLPAALDLRGEEAGPGTKGNSACVAAGTPCKGGAKPGPAKGPTPTTSEILAYGSAELMPRCRTAADRDLLTDALSLLAFNDPAASPAGYLLRPAHKVALAEELNGALLAARGLPPTSPLERLVQQAAVAVTELKRADHPQALALPDPRVLVLEPPAAAGPSGRASGSGDGAGDGGGDAMMS